MQRAVPAGYGDSDSDCDFGGEAFDRVETEARSDAGEPGEGDEASLMKRAINEGDVGAVEQLLNRGMDVDTRFTFGWTLLMCAANVANHQITKVLLDRGADANFCTGHFTVLMASCMASGSEDSIASCVGLLLAKHADPNRLNESHMTCLMLAARDGHSKILNLLASHGAKLDLQDQSGYTALSMAAQSGKVEAVLELLELGADKTIPTKAGKSPADLAFTFRHAQVFRILEPSSERSTSQVSTSKKSLSQFMPDTDTRVEQLEDLDVLLHGLDLGHLTDIMKESGITWSYLLTLDKQDLEKIGITDPEDQQKLEGAMHEVLMDKVDMDTLSNLATTDQSEELQVFLISMKKQCCFLTETIQDVISHFPQQSSQLVFSLDPQREAQALCTQLELHVIDLQKEVTCLRKLFRQMDEAKDCCQIPQPGYRSNRKLRYLSTVAVSVLGAGVLFVLYKASWDKIHLLLPRKLF
ncbi:ankyrin repeat, SAM and basic leucine zipper domain-containing protein 1 [Genypterus blacodes]|uniref:ankyrin repeat, SAM and basic leucine zipper domain-containing protein 1 n=1 Tax=Genypterus blacodes TaxID=154954 RepID=UPI003F757AA2